MEDIASEYLLLIQDLIDNHYLVNEKRELEIRIGTFIRNQKYTKGQTTDYNPTSSTNFNSNVSKEYFEKIKNYINAEDDYIQETIVYLADEYRVISNLTTNEKIYEKKIRNADVDIVEYNARISVSNEIPLTKLDFKNIKFRLLRYKKTYSKVINNWRYDLSTVVQSFIDIGGIALKNKIESIKLSEPTSYEVEIEFVGKNTKNILKEIASILLKSDNKTDNDILENVKTLINSTQKIFNNPITFLRKNIGQIEVNKYSVTEKADGERRLLYINSKNNAYYITTANETLSAPYIKIPKQTVIDGEFINNEKFLAFDILAYNGKSIINLNLDERLKILNEIKIKNKIFEIKKFYLSVQPLDIYKLNEKVLTTKYSYPIDGIILTPIVEPYYNSTTFKWKDPKDTSTDFLIRRVIGTSEWHLFVGITMNTFKQLKLQLDDNYKLLFPDIDINSNYFPVKFEPKTLKNAYLANFTDKEITKYKIEDNTIVELVLIDTKGTKPTWKFIKTREDKTKAYKNFLGNFGNNWKTAESNLEAITKPVTREMIIGHKKAQFFTGDQDTSSNIVALRKFHLFVKTISYETYIADSKWLLEIAVGRFGDLSRWVNNNIKNVVAIDNDAEAIKEGNERVKKLALKTKNIPKIYSDVQDLIETTDWSQIITDLVKKEIEFDNIVCHFALHFFMKSELTVATLVNNLANNIKKNGLVVMTAMDGQRVVDLFNKHEIPNNGTLELKKNNKVIFGLRKECDCSKLTKTGQLISVFVESIGSYNEEYLVNFDYLIKKMSKYFKVYQDIMFEKLYKKWKKQKDSANSNKIPDMSYEEITYSSLWRMIVFEKK